MPTTKNQCKQFIDARPTTCFRVLERELQAAFPDLSGQDERYISYLAAVRPECGYRCDGEDGPHPQNGSLGCFYSGKIER